jgi:hypothetical protein
MKHKSSYQARLHEIRVLQLEKEELVKDIYDFMGERGWTGRASAEAKWRRIMDNEHAELFGANQLKLFDNETTIGDLPKQHGERGLIHAVRGIWNTVFKRGI